MPLPGGFRDTLRQIRHRNPQPVFCPRCKSSDINQTPSFGIFTGKYRCKNCGYEGVIVMELEKDENSSTRGEPGTQEAL